MDILALLQQFRQADTPCALGTVTHTADRMRRPAVGWVRKMEMGPVLKQIKAASQAAV